MFFDFETLLELVLEMTIVTYFNVLVLAVCSVCASNFWSLGCIKLLTYKNRRGSRRGNVAKLNTNSNSDCDRR